jgi:hypothetical protein
VDIASCNPVGTLRLSTIIVKTLESLNSMRLIMATFKLCALKYQIMPLRRVFLSASPGLVVCVPLSLDFVEPSWAITK